MTDSSNPTEPRPMTDETQTPTLPFDINSLDVDPSPDYAEKLLERAAAEKRRAADDLNKRIAEVGNQHAAMQNQGDERIRKIVREEIQKWADERGLDDKTGG